MIVWICSRCNRKLDGNPRFCPHCGYTVYRPSMEEAKGNAEETARGRSDSAPEAKQAEEVNAIELDTEKAVVETVMNRGAYDAYWRRPHPRIITGPLTGDRP